MTFGLQGRGEKGLFGRVYGVVGGGYKVWG